jgi:hypothetical protein
VLETRDDTAATSLLTEEKSSGLSCEIARIRTRDFLSRLARST